MDAAQHPSTVVVPLDDTPEHRLAIWQVLAQRRSAYDNMLWQTPALGMTAQAFLFTLTLAPDVSEVGRVVAATLSMVIALVSAQLMSKHRRHEISDCLLLERLEESLGMGQITGFNPHAAGVARVPESWRPPAGWSYAMLFRSHSPTRLSSYGLWTIGQALFVLTDLAIIGLVVSGNGSVFS
jgi:hypothetical protein